VLPFQRKKAKEVSKTKQIFFCQPNSDEAKKRTKVQIIFLGQQLETKKTNLATLVTKMSEQKMTEMFQRKKEQLQTLLFFRTSGHVKVFFAKLFKKGPVDILWPSVALVATGCIKIVILVAQLSKRLRHR